MDFPYRKRSGGPNYFCRIRENYFSTGRVSLHLTDTPLAQRLNRSGNATGLFGKFERLGLYTLTCEEGETTDLTAQQPQRVAKPTTLMGAAQRLTEHVLIIGSKADQGTNELYGE